MAYKIQYLPVTGPLPGKSFEEQTAAFLSEIGTLAENATGSGSEAITIARAAQTTAQAAQTTAADAKVTAENAQNSVKSAADKADAALSSATSAMDTAADAKSAATAAETQSAAALSAARAAQTTADTVKETADTTAASLSSFMATAGQPMGLATLDGNGNVSQSVAHTATADTAAKAETLTDERIENGLPSIEGFTAANLYNTQAPGKGVPDGGWFTTLLTAHAKQVDGDNHASAQLFFGEQSRAWLRTSANSAPITDATPWIPILTTINGLQISAFSTLTAVNTQLGDGFTLPSGGTWIYYVMQVYTGGNVGQSYIGVVGGGTNVPNGLQVSLHGFYMKIA